MRDELLVFTRRSSALTASGLVGSAIDFSVARNIGVDRCPLYLKIRVLTAAGGGTNTGRFELRSHSATPSNTAGDVIWSSGNVAANTLTANAEIGPVPLPFSDDWDRYLGLVWIEVAAITALRVTAWLDTEPGSSDAFKYADAVN